MRLVFLFLLSCRFTTSCYVLFAMFNSGSTFIEHQLWANGLRPWVCQCNSDRNNWSATLTGGGRVWKHLPPKYWNTALSECEHQHDNVTRVFVVRDPRDWVKSSMKLPHTFHCNKKKMYSCVYTRVSRSGHSRVFARYSSLPVAWNTHVRDAIYASDIFVRYEDFVHDPVSATTELMKLITNKTWNVTSVQSNPAGKDAGISLSAATAKLESKGKTELLGALG